MNKSYLLNADESVFDKIDQLRELSKESRADYIRSAIAMKNDYVNDVVKPLIERQRTELDQLPSPNTYFRRENY